MKTLRFILVALFAIGLTHSCSDEPVNFNNESAFDQADLKAKPVPFKANLFTARNYDVNEPCDDPVFTSFNWQVGEGNATHLGKFSITIGFCESPGTGQYSLGYGVMTAANGDELYLQIPAEGDVGQVYPIDDPFYEFQFQDSFEIIGGTGRFQGATGEGYTDSRVNIFDDDGNFIPEFRTDHRFDGYIQLVPGAASN